MSAPRIARTRSASKFGSFASTQMAKRSAVTRRNFGSLWSGFDRCGSLLSPSIAKNAVYAENRMTTSKVTGMFAGRLQLGLPLMRKT